MFSFPHLFCLFDFPKKGEKCMTQNYNLEFSPQISLQLNCISVYFAILLFYSFQENFQIFSSPDGLVLDFLCVEAK